MPTYRGNAIAVGVLFILCSAAAILSIVPLGAPVGAPVDFAKLAANDNRVVLTALIEFVWAATGMGIAIGLYPILRKFNPASSSPSPSELRSRVSAAPPTSSWSGRSAPIT
jgi:hypothetical protein